MFHKHQISILECFLKNHVTLKTGIIAAENPAFAITEKRKKTAILNCNNISQYFCFTAFWYMQPW